jgi:hypothetical protein
MRIAVAAKMQNGLAGRVVADFAFEPDLADAAANLVGVVMRGLAQRLERSAEFDDVAITILPVVEEGEIGADGVDRGQRRALQGRLNLPLICAFAWRGPASPAPGGGSV